MSKKKNKESKMKKRIKELEKLSVKLSKSVKLTSELLDNALINRAESENDTCLCSSHGLPGIAPRMPYKSPEVMDIGKCGFHSESIDSSEDECDEDCEKCKDTCCDTDDCCERKLDEPLQKGWFKEAIDLCASRGEKIIFTFSLVDYTGSEVSRTLKIGPNLMIRYNGETSNALNDAFAHGKTYVSVIDAVVKNMLEDVFVPFTDIDVKYNFVEFLKPHAKELLSYPADDGDDHCITLLDKHDATKLYLDDTLSSCQGTYKNVLVIQSVTMTKIVCSDYEVLEPDVEREENNNDGGEN